MTLYFSSPSWSRCCHADAGEKVTPSRWIALGLGFTGVCLPATRSAARLHCDVARVGSRSAMGDRHYPDAPDRPARGIFVQIFYQNAASWCNRAVSFFLWVPPTPFQFLLLAAIGSSAAAQFLLFEGSGSPRSVMGTVEYTGLIWAFSLGY